MKAPGISFGLDGGYPFLRVTPSDRVSDAIWLAVEEAILAGWSVDHFRREAAQAWDHEKTQEVKRDNAEWRRP